MKRALSIFSLLCFLLIFSNCENEDDGFLVFNGCEDTFISSPLTEAELLPGDWQLNDVRCGLCSRNPSISDFNNPVIASFDDDGGVSVSEAGEVVQTGTWEITQDGRISVELQSRNPETSVPYFPTFAGICGDWLISDSSPSDGLGFFYRRR